MLGIAGYVIHSPCLSSTSMISFTKLRSNLCPYVSVRITFGFLIVFQVSIGINVMRFTSYSRLFGEVLEYFL